MILKKPIHVVQIFDNSYHYGKDEKSFEARKTRYSWKEKIVSQSGILSDGILTLNKVKVDSAKLKQCSLLLLIDRNRNSDQELLSISENSKDEENIRTGQIINSSFNWKCLQFRKTEFMEVNLVWDYWEIGKPERGNFKLYDLKKEEPVEININGKRDFSLTGRRKRTFIERNFILEYLGETKEYIFADDLNLNYEKRIPQNRKRINLLKELY